MRRKARGSEGSGNEGIRMGRGGESEEGREKRGGEGNRAKSLPH